MSDETEHSWLPFGHGVRLIGSHPVGILALEKPAGVMSHPNEDEPGDIERSLLRAPYDAQRECFQIDRDGAPSEIFLLHRLDSATSGVILLATNAQVAEAVHRRFQSHDVEKIYHAICRCRGQPGMHGMWVNMMEVAHRKKKGPVYAQDGRAVQARTQYKWMRSDTYGMELSLLELTPFTGRTHQLRYQCMKNRMPIVGDRVYGDFNFNRKVRSATGHKRLFLHASRIHINFPFGGEVIRFTAESPMPPEFEGLLGKDTEWVQKLKRKPTPGELAERKRAMIRDSIRGPHAKKVKSRRRHQ